MPSQVIENNKESSNENPRFKKRQNVMLEALRQHKGIVTYACEAAGVDKSTFYKWCKDNPEFKEAADNIQDYVLDVVEKTALEMITEDKNTALTVFYLKTRGKKRGYEEKQIIEHRGNLSSEIRTLINEEVTEQDF